MGYDISSLMKELEQTRGELEQEKERVNRLREPFKREIRKSESLQTELEQVKAELERSRGSHMFQYGLSLELEIKRLKEEREHWHKKWAEDKDALNAAWEELSAKDKVLEWYADTGIKCNGVNKARSILSQYRGESK